MSIITIKNLKYAEFLSEETPAYTATIYKDGKRWCIGNNDGHGGCDNYYILPNSKINHNELWQEIKEFEKTLAPITFNGSTMNNSLEFIVSDLVNDNLTLRAYKKGLKSHVKWLMPNKPESIWRCKTNRIVTTIAKIKLEHKDCFILNNATDQEILAFVNKK